MRFLPCLFTSILALNVLQAQIVPQLGDAPLAPVDLTGLPSRGPVAQLITGGFTVDTKSRESVRSFYNAVYLLDVDPPMGSSAVVASCFQGTNAPAFYESVLRRINWYRAMAGIPANVGLNTTDCVKN